MIKQRILAVILGCFIILQFSPTLALAKNTTVRSMPVPQEAYDYVEENLASIYNIVNIFLNEDGLATDINTLLIGTPFTVTSDTSPDSIVFPILDNGKALYSVELSYYDSRYYMSIGDFYCNTLNTQSGSLLFFFAEGNKFYENNDEVEVLTIYNVDIDEDELMALYENGEEYTPVLPVSPARFTRSSYEEIDIEAPVFLFEEVDLPVQTRALIESDLSLTKVEQDIPGTCWAATCSSIIGWYEPVMNYTASGICRQIHGFSHERGCSGSRLPGDVQRALYEVGNAKITAGPFQKITFSLVKSEIGARFGRPIFAHGEVNANAGHDVAIIGWYDDGKEKMLRLLDSGTSKDRGKPYTEFIQESNGNITFKYSNFTFKDFILTSN